MKQKHGPRYAVPSFTVYVRGEHGCAIVRSLDAAKAQAECYLSSRPGGVVDIDYSEQCGYCHGTGRVSKKRPFTWKLCRCKGKPELVPDMRIASVVGPNWAP